MIYAIINKDMATKAGFQENTHNVYDSMMIVNENELRKRGGDINDGATSLGGHTMTNPELKEWLRTRK